MIALMFHIFKFFYLVFSQKVRISFPRKQEVTEAHSEQSQTSKMKIFAKIVNGWESLRIFAKSLILDVCLGSEYTFGQTLNFSLFFYANKLPKCKCIDW